MGHTIGGLPCTEALQHILETAVALDHVLHTKLAKQHLLTLQTAWKQKDKKYRKVTIDDPPSDYFSSDEPSSDSEEDLN